MAAIWVATGDVLPWIDNPRKKDESHIESVVASIEATARAAAKKRGDDDVDLEDGFGAVLVANLDDKEIIAGHTRLYAAAKLGMLRVPVRFLDVPEDAAHRLARADNRLTNTGRWDLERLVSQLKADAELDFALVEQQGWNRGELDALIESAKVTLPDGSPENRQFTAGANALVELEVPRDKLGSIIERLRVLASEVGATVSIV